MTGTSARFRRLLDKNSRRSFMVAFDRTLSMGPEPFAEDTAAALERIAADGADAILMSPGLIKQHAEQLAYRGGPALVCRLDFPFLAAADLGRGEQFRTIVSVEEAAALGADAVVMFHIVGYAEKKPWADNVAAIGDVAERCRRLGIPLIVEAVPWGSESPSPQDPRLVAQAVRTAAELGADAIKTEYLGNRDTMASVIGSCPVPVFVLGGPKQDAEALLTMTSDALGAGASGVIYGRNVWQREDSAAVAASLTKLIHGDARR
jgi:class I fructose-bisphosphate aldolase